MIMMKVILSVIRIDVYIKLIFKYYFTVLC